MSARDGIFITFEGIEGVGKSTQVTLAVAYLAARGHQVVETREPGGTRIGELIRDLVLRAEHPPMARETELMLMFAARAEHLEKVIKPSLEQRRWVVCDRFTDASYAYQGGGREIPDTRIAVLERFVQGDLRPDLTFLLDAPVEVALERAQKRGPADRFDSETVVFFTAVRAAYHRRAAADPRRFRLIDANVSIADAAAAIQTHLNELGA
jgi:dTMP kinase